MSLRILAIAFAVVAVVFGVAGRANAQDSEHGLRVVDVDVTEVGESAWAVKYEASVEILNDGAVDFDGVARVDYQVDDDPSQIVYVITELGAGESTLFRFRFELMPGDHLLGIVIGEVVHETEVYVAAGDLQVALTGERVVPGGKVELDIDVSNVGDRAAEEIGIIGQWQDATGTSLGEGEVTSGIERLEPGETGTAMAVFEVEPGSYTFTITVTTSTVASNKQDDAIGMAYDVEFVELDVKLISAESLRWISGESALMEIGIEITNYGVDRAEGVEVGFECRDGSCSGANISGVIPVGETIEAKVEVWMPLGHVSGSVYAGANEQTFRWGDNNAVSASINVPESPPLVWSLERVSDGQEIQYWSDGSANVVFETTLRNEGSELVYGNIPISVECVQNEMVVEDCGGVFELGIDPTVQPNVLSQTIRVPQGETELIFMHGEEGTFAASAFVPERILGVDREIWECFSDTSNLRRASERDAGVGCGGWRNDYVVKWKVGVPIRVWTSGDEHYQEIFSGVLDDLAAILGFAFETAQSKRDADVEAFLGLPRDDTKLEGLRCNRAAGCATFDVNSDGTIGSAKLVIWPPLTSLDSTGVDHMIYSIALHELLHVLTGMLHRHHDRTSVMSYESLDYKTLGETDLSLLLISSHPLVQPKMSFPEVRELVVFDDELVDPPDDLDRSVRQLLRHAHAALMDSGTARYEIKGGWPSCNLGFGTAEYEIGNLNPRSPRWVHFKNEDNDFYLIRSPSPDLQLEFWVNLLGRWRLVPGDIVQQAVSFRDSFTNPLSMLSSINIYGLDEDWKAISEEDDRLTIQITMEGADVRASWSRKTVLDVEMEINVEDFTIERYEMTWTLDPKEANVCSDYHVKARLLEYGLKFELPETILSHQPSTN